MALAECAPWLFEGEKEEHEVSLSEAEAVQRLFSSDFLTTAEAEAEAKKKSPGAYLPLHDIAYRAKGRHAIAVFTAVFNAYPSAAKETDSHGSLPLHTVAMRVGDCDGGLEAIQMLLKEYPQAAREKNGYGDMPIHLICYNEKATVAMVRELLSACPQGINEESGLGMKPYEFAAALGSLPADAIDFLCRAEQGPSVIPPFRPLHPADVTPAPVYGPTARVTAAVPRSLETAFAANTPQASAMTPALLSPAVEQVIHALGRMSDKQYDELMSDSRLTYEDRTALRRARRTIATACPPAPAPAPSSSAAAARPLESAPAANTSQASAITADNAPAVFISLRFGEGMPEAKALQDGLHARGISAFLCDVPEGQDLAHAVVMALTHCKLAVILGTKTYGKKTKSSFSTFEELDYIFELSKPYFLIKMCAEFEEPETLFRLPSRISYFPWQPASEAERRRLPAGLVDKIIRRLQDVTQGNANYVAPPVAAVNMGPAPGVGPAHSADAAVDTNSAAAAHDLGQWLRALKLDDFEVTLRKLGAEDAHDVKMGFAEGDITKEMLEAEGLKPLRISRLQRKASEIE